MRRKHPFLLCLVVLSFFLFGCSETLIKHGYIETTRIASKDLRDHVVQMDVPSGKSLLFLIRNTKSPTFTYVLEAYLDDKPFGLISNPAFLAATIDPGEHLITARLTKGRKSSFKINTNTGNKYYFIANDIWRALSVPGMKIEELSAAQGEMYIQSLNLSGDNYYSDTL